ncbi:hypothetical protein QF025_006663 [Paraburkholderia graminis]|uniref:Uncharacterized protein n=1 Tax=Paraburkholderia graminis TaxID=60548 RepID=A0ABD5CSE9_9BURK|nr:hypothetical protein [Paraburkholderia graminis]
MLTPHEIAALMVAASTPDRVDVGGAEFHALLTRNLVSVDSAAPSHRCLRVTASGHRLITRLDLMR